MSPLKPALNQQLCCLRKEIDSISETVIGGSSQNLIEWTTGEDYRLPAINRDSDDVITTASVLWPDGRTGTFTTTVKNNTFLTVDAFTITYNGAPARTITQPLVTRNANGATTVIPNLIIS